MNDKQQKLAEKQIKNNIMKEDIGISIIVPTFNRGKVISIAINSIIAQTYKNYEIIIVDDYSDDNTEEIINELYKEKLRYIKNNGLKGACSARNLGINIAKYELITFLDSDDCWKENYLKEQIEFYLDFSSKDESFGLQFCSYYFHKGYKKMLMPNKRFDISNKNKTLKSLSNGNFISTQTIVTTKSVLKEIGGFDVKLNAFQDWDLVLRISNKHSIHFLPQVLVDIYLSDDSISTKHTMRFKSLEYLVNKHSNILAKKYSLRLKWHQALYYYMYNPIGATKPKILTLLSNGFISINSHYSFIKCVIYWILTKKSPRL